MKLKYYILFAVALSFFVFFVNAQTTIPNGDFESWVNVETPTGWSASNIHTTYMGFPVDVITVTKDSTTQHGGAACVKLFSKLIMMGLPVNPGYLTTGTFWYTLSPQAGGVKGGTPFTGRPDTIKGWYKSTLMGTDKTTISWEFWAGAHTTLVAGDTTQIATSAPSWVQFSIPVTYHDTITPDSMNIVFSSSDIYNQTNITASSELYVDDIELVYGQAGIIDPVFSPEFFVYAESQGQTLVVSMNFNVHSNTIIRIYNISGQLIEETVKNIDVSKEYIDISNFSEGLYILDVIRTNGQRFVQKFVVR